MTEPSRRILHPVPAARWPTAEQAARSLLFTPLQVGRLSLATRTWVPAMVPWRATEEGFVTPEVLQWYERFARGRPGALVVEATGIRDIKSGPLLRVGHDRFVPGLQELVRTVRRASGGETRLFLQILDFLTVRRRVPAETYLVRFLPVDESRRERLAAVTGDEGLKHAPEPEVRARLVGLPRAELAQVLSARELEDLDMGYRERVTDLHLPHIRALPAVLPGLFADAAARAFAAGFDGVELHFAHAYTMASFLSRLNTRDDGYGGSLEGRVRLPLEVLDAVRARVGEQVVGIRFLADEAIPGGSDVADAAHFGVCFARAGADYLSLSKGGKFEDARQPRVGHAVYPYTGPSGLECMPTVWSDARGPFARNAELGARVRAAVRAAGFTTPVVTAGGLNDFEQMEGILQRGEADLCGAARQSLADPDWWEKMRSGRGAEVRRCKFTSYCEGLDQMHKEVTCQLWDRAFRPGDGAPLARDGKRRLLAP